MTKLCNSGTFGVAKIYPNSYKTLVTLFIMIRFNYTYFKHKAYIAEFKCKQRLQD